MTDDRVPMTHRGYPGHVARPRRSEMADWIAVGWVEQELPARGQAVAEKRVSDKGRKGQTK